jgi:hypothetical protein
LRWGHPGLGPRRVATRLARPEWGRLVVSPKGVYKTLLRHGLNTRAKRLALVGGYRAPFEPPRDSEPEPHVESEHPGELVEIDCFFVGRLHGTVCPPSGPTVEHTSALARRVAAELQGSARAHGGGRALAWSRLTEPDLSSSDAQCGQRDDRRDPGNLIVARARR